MPGARGGGKSVRRRSEPPIQVDDYWERAAVSQRARRDGYFAGATFSQVESGLYAVTARAAASVPGPRFFW
jgi:hypothetical protein